MVDAAKLHSGDSFSSHLDGIDPLLGANAGMGLQALNVKLHAIGSRSPGEQKSHRVAIEY